MSDNKQIIPFSSRKEIIPIQAKTINWLSKRGIIEKPLIGPSFIIRPHKPNKAIMKDNEDLKSQLEYYEEMIKELQGELGNKDSSITSLKDALNSLSEKSKYIKSLTTFRNMFCVECIVHNTIKTIIQCTESIKSNQCTFHETCKERDKVLKMFIL